MNNSVRLDNHKGSLPITCHSDYHRPVRVQLADNSLKFVDIGNGLSIDLFDNISRPERLRSSRTGINAGDNHSIHVLRNVGLGPKPLRQIPHFNSPKEGTL
jgi:hypothetical protein